MRTAILILLLVGFHTSSAQTIIPRAGMTFSTTSTHLRATDVSNNSEIKFTSGYYAGLAFEVPMGTDHVSFQPEIIWIQKGNIAELEPLTYFFEPAHAYFTYSSKNRYTLNYLEMPLLVRWKPASAKEKFFMVGGISVSYGLSGKWHRHYITENTSGRISVSSVSEISYNDPPDGSHSPAVFLDNRMDMGLQVGIGATLIRGLSIEARYGHGLTGFSDRIQKTSFKNRVLQFGLTMPLQIKRRLSDPPSSEESTK